MLQDELIAAFHKTQSFKWDPKGGFKLASGLLSPFYVDCRTLMAFPHARHLVAKKAWEVIKDLQIDCLGGLEIGAISIATSISDYAYSAAPRREWRTFCAEAGEGPWAWSISRRCRAYGGPRLDRG